MSLSSAQIQQALRISKAIEEHLLRSGGTNVSSEDLYDMLADQRLVERDAEKGKHFRALLTQMAKANMLNLIPQCHAMPRSGGKYDWSFNRAPDRMPKRTPSVRLQNKPISLFFDTSEFTASEIAEMIAFLSEVYESVGGDELEIVGTTSYSFQRCVELAQ